MKYTPQRTDSSASIIAIICFIAAVLLFAVSRTTFPYPILFQLLAVIVLAFSIFFFIRYRLTEFIYTICSGDGGFDFSVRRVQGKNEVIIARFDMADVKKVKPVDQKNWKRDPDILQYGKDTVKLYNYCANLHPENPFAFIFDNHDGTYTALIIEPGNDMVKYAQSFIPVEFGTDD